MPTWLIWVIVVIVVLAVVLAVVALTSRRRSENRRARADQLRQEATAQASGLAESERQAEELRAKADLARAEAQKAEQKASTAEEGHQVEQASYEDKLREADRLDPEVDHRAKDYEPDVWNDERTTSSTTEPSQTAPSKEEGPTDGAHRATTAETPTATSSETPTATTSDSPTTTTTERATTSDDPNATSRTRPTE